MAAMGAWPVPWDLYGRRDGLAGPWAPYCRRGGVVGPLGPEGRLGGVAGPQGPVWTPLGRGPSFAL